MSRILALILATAMVPSAFASGTEERPEELPTFTVLLGEEPGTLDPSLIGDEASALVHNALFEGLLVYDRSSRTAEPGIAERWDVSDDGLTWTFHLRDARWNDGTPITSQTVVDSWLRTLDPATGAPYAWLIGMVVVGARDYTYGEGSVGREAVQIRAVDEHTFQVELLEPASCLPAMLSHGAFGVLPLHAIEQHGDRWTEPGRIVSNGPFRLEKHTRDGTLVLVRDEAYRNVDDVRIGTVVCSTVQDPSERYQRYLSGDADWLRGEIPEERLEVAALRDDFHMHPLFATHYLEPNLAVEPLGDPRVRKALSMVIDRKHIADSLLTGPQVPSHALVPESAGYRAPESPSGGVEDALQLLEEAGYPNGEGMPELGLLTGDAPGHRRVGRYLSRVWSERLGVTVTVESLPWSELIERARKREFGLLSIGWRADYPDPQGLLEVFRGDSQTNHGGYSREEYDDSLSSASLLPPSGPSRARLLADAERMLVLEDQAVIPLYHYARVDLLDTDVWGGWSSGPATLRRWTTIHLKGD